MLLARRWSKVMAVLVAVGAVSGTVLSYEMGLLWPGLMGRYGAAIGLPFSLEGIFFFLEAIFVGVYLYGWQRLSPWAHWWTGMPIVVSGILGAISVVAANSWMNSPAGYTLTNGKISSVDPVSVFFNASTPYEATHMILAAYMVTGFVVAGVYAVGLLRGRRDRYHRLGFGDPVHDRRDRGPAAGDDGRRHRPVHRPQPAAQVRRDGVRPHDPAATLRNGWAES